MSFEYVREGRLLYLRSTILDTPHCFSTRFGGVSTGFLSEMNLGVNRGEPNENVAENFRILGRSVGFKPEDTVFQTQLHSTIVDRVGAEDRGTKLYKPQLGPGRDGTVTDEPNVALTVYGADCPTILFHDPVRRAIGAVHAGWKGTAAGMARVAVEKMASEFGSRPGDLRAAIGPAIGRCCFETHGEVPDAIRALLGDDAERCIDTLSPDEEGRMKYKVDLKLANELVLRRAGLEQIDVCPVCTMCEHDTFWSHRYTHGVRGAGAAIIVLKDNE